MKGLRKKAEKTGTFLDESELNRWNQVNAQWSRARMILADIEMQKFAQADIVDKMDKAKQALSNELVAKYGENIIINGETGQVKKQDDIGEN